VTATIKVGDHPYCVVTNTDGSRAYVSNTGADSVSVIDTKLQKVIATIPVGGFPEGISYDAKHNRIYVASWMDDALDVIDAKTNQKTNSIATGSKSRAFGQFIGNPH
jgi:YVTN family beta-propeller protein